MPTATAYPGSKASSGTYHQIIRQQPPHRIYVEAYAGHGAVLRHKKPAAENIIIDIDPKVIAWWVTQSIQNLRITPGDALSLLPEMPELQQPDTLLYLDPPYLKDCRSRDLYDHEFNTVPQHRTLLAMLRPLPCLVMISHYPHELYDNNLHLWRRHDYLANTRAGMKPESLYCNFDAPLFIHDIRYAGNNFRERTRISRKAARWRRMLESMEPLERQVILSALADSVGIDNLTTRRRY